MPKKGHILTDCPKEVSLFLDDRLVLQGEIVDHKDRYDNCPAQPFSAIVEMEAEFITLKLKCDSAIVSDNGSFVSIAPPLFKAGDFVRINVNEIIANGPFHECPPAAPS